MTSKQVHYICLIIIQGYQDDITTNETDFADRAESIQLIQLLTDLAENYKDSELQDVITHTLERANDSRELILNLESRSKGSKGSSSLKDGGKKETDEEIARKRRAAAAASRK